VSERNYRTILKECPEAALRSGTGMSPACTAAVKQMDDNLGGMFDYSLYVHGSVTTKPVRLRLLCVDAFQFEDPHARTRVFQRVLKLKRTARGGRYDDCIYDEGFRRRLEEGTGAAAAGKDERAGAVAGAFRSERGGLNDYACPST
jgi:hypothetical protein